MGGGLRFPEQKSSVHLSEGHSDGAVSWPVVDIVYVVQRCHCRTNPTFSELMLGHFQLYR